MTTVATASAEAEITARLTQALAPTRLVVTNDSRHHAGHMATTAPASRTSPWRSRAPPSPGSTGSRDSGLVNQALADLLRDRIHALAIRARAPGEA